MNGLPSRLLIITFLMTLAAVLGIPISALASDSVHCTRREDRQMKRWVTTCTDGARAITKYDEAFKRYRTDVITPPKGDKPPRGWPTPGKASR